MAAARLKAGARVALVVLGAVALASAATWAVSVRWTAYRGVEFPRRVGIESGCFIYAWSDGKERAALVRAARIPATPKWEWHLTRRAQPMEWWPPVRWDSRAGSSVVVVRLAWLAAASAGG